MGDETEQRKKYIPPSMRRREQQKQPKADYGRNESVSPSKEVLDAKVGVDQKEGWDTQGENLSYAKALGAYFEDTNNQESQKPKAPLTSVQMRSTVFLDILHHCMNQYPTPVNGQLMGSEQPSKKPDENYMEITASFALPQKKDIYAQVLREKAASAPTAGGGAPWIGDRELDSRVEEEYEAYQDKMGEFLHDLRADYFTIGYYQTVTPGAAFERESLDGLLAYHEAVGNAIMIIYDPLCLQAGELPLKAFKVNVEALRIVKEKESAPADSFINVAHDTENNAQNNNSNRFGQSNEKDLSLEKESMLIEIPIVIKNNFLDHAFINSWLTKSPHLSDGGTIAAKLQFLSMQDKFTEKNMSRARDQGAILPPYANVLSNICLDSDSSMASLVSYMHSFLDTFAEETDRFHRYIRVQYRQLLFQRQARERRRLEEERRKLRGDDLQRADDWGPEMDGDLWEELRGLKKVDPPSPSTWFLLNGEVSRREEELHNICRKGIASLGLVKLLHGSNDQL